MQSICSAKLATFGQQSICSAKLATFGQQAIFRTSLQYPWPADDSANFQHVQANDCDPPELQHSQRNLQDPRPAKRPSLAWPANKSALKRQPRYSASKRFSAPASRILRQQTTAPTYSMCKQTSSIRQTSDKRPRSANLQDPRPAKRQSLASKRKRQPRASLSCEQASAAPCHFSRLFEHSANQTPNSLASGSLVSKFVDQPRQAKDSANPEDLCPVEKVLATITCIARFPANAPKRQSSAEFACVWKFRASAAISRSLSQQTTYSASLPDPSPTNDSTNLQHVPANNFGSLKLQ